MSCDSVTSVLLCRMVLDLIVCNVDKIQGKTNTCMYQPDGIL